MKLKDAFMRILSMQPKLGIVKISNKPEGLFRIINIRKGDEMYRIDSEIDLKNKINDKKYIKTYFSDELNEDFKIYGLARLGIEFLLYKAEIEEAQKAEIIFANSFYKKVQEYFTEECDKNKVKI